MALALVKPTISTLLLVFSLIAGAGLLVLDLLELPRPVARVRAFALGNSGLSGSVPFADRAEGLSTGEAQSKPIVRHPGEPQPLHSSAVPLHQVPRKHNFTFYQFAHRYGDLPPLPARRRPRKDKLNSWWNDWDNGETAWDTWDGWDNSIAICACMFRENLTDVREWLLYHQWLGVDHVYLTENSNPPPEGMLGQLQDFIDSGFLTFEAIGRPDYQPFFYHSCALQHRHKHNWMAFIDLDEFIVVRKKGTSLKQYLDGFKDEAALAMHWVMVGPSHRDHRPREGGALRAYTECVQKPAGTVKSIANLWYLANFAGNPHVFEYRDNMHTVNEKRIELPWKGKLPQACTDGTIASPELDVNCRPVPDITLKHDGTADDIAVYHYLTKSREDFEMKVGRGGGGGTHRTWKHFRGLQRGSEPGGICEDPAKLAEECCDPRRYVLQPPDGKAATPTTTGTKNTGRKRGAKRPARKRAKTTNNA